MPTFANVRQDDDVIDFGGYLVGKAGKNRWRVYKDATSYSSRSGQVMIKGAVMRDVDGSMFTFYTQTAAEQWITDGCKVSLG